MVECTLTSAQTWIIRHGFYGHWWEFPPYKTEEYQRRFNDCMKEYESRFIDI